jgi:hypothetical protein
LLNLDGWFERYDFSKFKRKSGWKSEFESNETGVGPRGATLLEDTISGGLRT